MADQKDPIAGAETVLSLSLSLFSSLFLFGEESAEITVFVVRKFISTVVRGSTIIDWRYM